MGVPVFFKWLSMRNPRILIDAKQPEVQDYNSGNPYIDNFYVDMNGLIHPSVNPKGQNIKVPKDFQQQCQNIYLYMDKIMNIVRPKKIIYLAIDGVAPRAKMNQQRSRRFRAAMQSEQSKKQKQKLYEEYKKMDIVSHDIEDYVFKESFDSNVITPGTPFLSELSERIRNYIKKRLSSDRLWKDLTVIFSDANCPGQGQHKIMDFIRQERASPGYNPNQSHCIYGADADLIMLGLATHEPRFFIIRQIVVTANDKWCTTCGKKGHFFTDCTVADSIQNQLKTNQAMNAASIGVSFQFIKIKGVREFIHVNYVNCTFNEAFQYDLERVIDDFVFLCFFVGNDFLPHIPCLSIRDGGIDVLMRVYEHCLKLMQGYITNAGRLNLKSLKVFIKELSSYQPQLVGQLINKQSNQKQRQNFQKNIKPNLVKNLQEANSKKNKDNFQSSIDPHDLLGSFKEQIKNRISTQQNLDDYSSFNHDIYNYKEKYYSEKFRIQPSEFLQLKNNISRCYIQALEWICRYYYQGVPSWGWFYPFHYSPFLTDIKVPDQNTVFELGRPFRPYQQLMGVLPKKTYQALPKCLHNLMLDKNSVISDYFPQKFEIDLVGKKFAWLGEVLLPFIDSNRLLRAMGNYEQNLTVEQKRLNRLGTNNLYISRYGELGRTLSNTENLQIGQKIKVNNQQHNITGDLILLMQYNDTVTYEFYFYEPIGLSHSVKLKEGIQYNPLEEISKDFISKTDKRSYGGERFTRVVERSLAKRIQTDRRRNIFSTKLSETQQRDDQSRQPRQRSRDQYKQRDNYNNNRNNYNQRQRNNYQQQQQSDRNPNYSRANYHMQNTQYHQHQQNYTNSNNYGQNRNSYNYQQANSYHQHQQQVNSNYQHYNQNQQQHSNNRQNNYRQMNNQQQGNSYYQNQQQQRNLSYNIGQGQGQGQGGQGQGQGYNNNYNQRPNQ